MASLGARHHVSPAQSEHLANAIRQVNASRVTANAAIRYIREAERPDLGEAIAQLEAVSLSVGLVQDQLRIHH